MIVARVERVTTLDEMDELMRLGAPNAPAYDDEVLLSCSCSVIKIQTSSITNRWYRFWCQVGIFVMQCAGTMMTQHLITIKKVAHVVDLSFVRDPLGPHFSSIETAHSRNVKGAGNAACWAHWVH